ncbi:unnamed protein product [Ceratitis capitata]|uniref:(Mediterranean fruit fly) hypothetical protein n=1 Tax=Ceratitis capitata TaxID=7213 RepID=A0A811V5E5_CERCA|nr:unnamed protein product [Ceratitis capitata]
MVFSYGITGASENYIHMSVITFAGVSGFILSKNSVDKRRYQDMQIRERMRKSNIGDYEPIGDRRFSG